MRRTVVPTLFAFCAAVLPSIPAAAEEQSTGRSFSVSGITVTQPMTWTVDKLRTDFAAVIKPIEYDSHGKHHTAIAVPLLAVLERAGVPDTLKMDPRLDPKIKNPPLRLAVFVKGRDGYVAALALAELLPDIGNRGVWLTLDADGKPLADRSTPIELIVPEDAKPGRWVRGVAEITVVGPKD